MLPQGCFDEWLFRGLTIFGQSLPPPPRGVPPGQMLAGLCCREDHSPLNMSGMRGDADVRYSQEGVHGHRVDLKAVVLVNPHPGDKALQRSMEHLRPIESEGDLPDGAGHEKEGPSRPGEFLLKLVRAEVVLDGHPGVRTRFVLEVEASRMDGVLFYQNGSGIDHYGNRSTRPYPVSLPPASDAQMTGESGQGLLLGRTPAFPSDARAALRTATYRATPTPTAGSLAEQAG